MSEDGHHAVATTGDDLTHEELDDFLDSLETFTPAIPDEVISYYLQRTGFKTNDKRVLRLVSLSAQKFISEVCTDSFHFCKQRQQNTVLRDKQGNQQTAKDKRYVLNSDDLANSLAEYGISVRKPEYYSDTVTTNYLRKQNASSGGGGNSTSGGGSDQQQQQQQQQQ